MSVIGNPILVIGSKDVFALISVTYPAGSVCTASNGIVTLTAGDTSGQTEFEIPTPASLPETWTISITDGNKTKSKTVSITQKWQIEAVALNYRLYLYDHGDQCTDVTGGWKSGSGAPEANYSINNATFGNSYMQVSAARLQCCAVNTINAINVTFYNTLYFECNGSSVYPAAERFSGAGLSSQNTAWAGKDSVAGESNNVSSPISIDISSLTGSYYAYFCVWNWNASTGTEQITAVYME